jgi:hypothetical protein
MPYNKPPIPGRYIDPLVDFAFKKIFGSEPNKDLLIAFLNEVFRGRKHIFDLGIIKTNTPAILKMKAPPYLTCFAQVQAVNSF